VLRALQERGLVFEVMTHADQLLVAAEGLQSHGDLVVVVEHAGWPRNGSDDERALWAAGINALAGLGDNVLCKISGLAMPLRSMAVDVLAPWLEHVIDAFGVDRCLFASNFPVDGIHGTFDELYTAYSAITSGLGDEARDKLFAANAERIYRC
jgi:predicted TIM-barrel fold metal-dependent hydrolase